MKAIVCTRYGSPEVLQLQHVAKPVPQKNQVLIKVHATTVNSTDPIDRKGEPFIARLASGLFKPRIPIPGGVFSGEIEEKGEDVTKFQKGDQVFGATGLALGTHAEYVCIAEHEAIAAKPTTLNDEEAAAIVDGALTALPFLRDKAKLQKNQSILIYGASGSVGTAAVQLAKLLGAHVTGVCSTKNMELVRSLGADQVIDYTKEDFTQMHQTYDVIFDAVGKKTFSQCKHSLTSQGIYLTTVPSFGIVFQMLWTSFFGSKKAIFAATGLRSPHEKAKDLEELKEIIDQGKLKAVIDQRYPLEEMAEAHRYVEKGHKVGNVVISMM